MRKITLLMFICFHLNSYGQDTQLAKKQIEKIKNEVIGSAEKFAEGLNSLNYNEIMSFYVDVDTCIVFGDGYYWGGYDVIDNIWKAFTEGVKENTWSFSNIKVHVFTNEVASLLVEFDHKRIEQNGANIGGHGCISFGMQKMDMEWKAVTMHVTHNYNVYDENGDVRKWWEYFIPKKKE